MVTITLPIKKMEQVTCPVITQPSIAEDAE